MYISEKDLELIKDQALLFLKHAGIPEPKRGRCIKGQKQELFPVPKSIRLSYYAKHPEIEGEIHLFVLTITEKDDLDQKFKTFFDFFEALSNSRLEMGYLLICPDYYDQTKYDPATSFRMDFGRV